MKTSLFITNGTNGTNYTNRDPSLYHEYHEWYEFHELKTPFLSRMVHESESPCKSSSLLRTLKIVNFCRDFLHNMFLIKTLKDYSKLQINADSHGLDRMVFFFICVHLRASVVPVFLLFLVAATPRCVNPCRPVLSLSNGSVVEENDIRDCRVVTPKARLLAMTEGMCGYVNSWDSFHSCDS